LARSWSMVFNLCMKVPRLQKPQCLPRIQTAQKGTWNINSFLQFSGRPVSGLTPEPTRLSLASSNKTQPGRPCQISNHHAKPSPLIGRESDSVSRYLMKKKKKKKKKKEESHACFPPCRSEYFNIDLHRTADNGSDQDSELSCILSAFTGPGCPPIYQLRFSVLPIDREGVRDGA
jgi:hypothetical protein